MIINWIKLILNPKIYIKWIKLILSEKMDYLMDKIDIEWKKKIFGHI